MGYAFGSTEFRLPKLLHHTLLVLTLIRTLISALFHSLLRHPNDFLTDPQIPSPARPNHLPDLYRLFPVTKFSDLVAEYPPEETCAVCLHDFHGGDEIRQLTNCRHVFHRSCLDTWMDQHKTCPLCRAPFVH